MHERPNITSELCQVAIDAALAVDVQLNLLMDAFDFFITRYPPTTEEHLFEMQDVQVSIKELGRLPHEIATWMSDIRNGRKSMLSKEGFEINVLNEFTLHMHSLALFLTRKHVSLGDFSPSGVGNMIRDLKRVNRLT